MKKNKILSKLFVSMLAVGVLSTNLFAANASEINSKNVTSITEEFNLESVDKVPANAKILKFDTVEDAEKFLKTVQENNDSGILDLSTLVSSDELNKQVVDLSNKEISESNFRNVDVEVPSDNGMKSIPSSNIKTADYNTTLKDSTFLGLNKINAKCSVKVKWNKKKGNYISSVRNVTTSFTGATLGTAWEQTSYDDNISSDGKSVDVTVYGTFDYYLLIETSLTKLAGADEEFDFTFEL